MRLARMLGILLVLTSLVSVLGAGPATTAPVDLNSTRMIAELGQSSTLLIVTEFNGSVVFAQPDAFMQPTSNIVNVDVNLSLLGSGFFVSSDGYVVTAGHVVGAVTSNNYTTDQLIREELAVSAANNYLSQGQTFSLAGQMQLVSYISDKGNFSEVNRSVYAVLGEVPHTLEDIRKEGWPARVFQASPTYQYDLALLKVEGYQNCPVLIVGNSSEILMGDPVFAFGFPALSTLNINPLQGQNTTLAPSMTSGEIGGIRQTDNGTPVFQTDAAFTHGSSGGPGLNESGEVVGVAVSGSEDPESGQVLSGFNFMIQSNPIREILANNSVNNTKGPVDEHFMQGLTYFYAGHYSAVLNEFQTVVGLFSKQWRAQALLDYCRTAIDQGRDVPLSSTAAKAAG